MSRIKEKENVIKHSSAIHISGDISLVERKIWNVLLANAYDDLLKTDIYKIQLSSLSKILNFCSNNYEYLKESLRVLNRTQVEWNILGKDGREWGVFTLISSVSFKNGICYYSYAPDLRKRLYNPTMYAKISLSMQNKFESKYALIIYELCIDFYRIRDGFGETPYISIIELRKMLGLSDDEYMIFKSLNSQVIKKAILEINKKTSINVDIFYNKEKTKVVDVKFSMSRNDNFIPISCIDENKKILQPVEVSFIHNELLDVLINEFGVSKNKVIQLLDKYDISFINEILSVVREELVKGKVKNIPAFTVKAIENDFRRKKPEIIRVKEQKQKEVKQVDDEETRRYNAHFEYMTKANMIYERLSDAERQEIDQEAESLAEAVVPRNSAGFRTQVKMVSRIQVIKEKFSKEF